MSILKKTLQSTAEGDQNFLKDWEKLNKKPVSVKISIDGKRKTLSKSGAEHLNGREDPKDTDNQ